MNLFSCVDESLLSSIHHKSHLSTKSWQCTLRFYDGLGTLSTMRDQRASIVSDTKEVAIWNMLVSNHTIFGRQGTIPHSPQGETTGR